MVHPHEHTLVGVDDNNISCLTPHANSAITEETILFHGVEDSADGGDNHFTHLTQVVDCHLKLRKDQNMCGPNATRSRSVLYHSVKSTDAKKEDECVDECVDSHVDGCVDSHVDCYVGK
eukprot:15329929-Ditylum_brightwellii.AAC.1